jgi:hypothetical protein
MPSAACRQLRRSVAVIYAETAEWVGHQHPDVLLPGQIAIAPDSLGRFQGVHVFLCLLGSSLRLYKWTVNGIPGGNATVGTIDSTDGYYSAPGGATCARDRAS